jgi:outer membrane biosynthesis protein TonB
MQGKKKGGRRSEKPKKSNFTQPQPQIQPQAPQLLNGYTSQPRVSTNTDIATATTTITNTNTETETNETRALKIHIGEVLYRPRVAHHQTLHPPAAPVFDSWHARAQREFSPGYPLQPRRPTNGTALTKTQDFQNNE